jgi:hypothetical protein
MQQFKSIKKIHLAILNLLFIGGVLADPIGEVIEQTGSGQIIRDKEEITVSGAYMPAVELNDIAETANGKMKIEFLDNAQLDLKEHTEVLIDEIYYDPDPSLSKMSMKFTMGTARFASGSLGLINKANIDIQTPTATIGIRGTDFTTTIDELGRSLIVLLPDQYGNPSGEITVTNLGGTITLNQAYQATMVSSLDKIPTNPIQINGITPSMIDNMFIVNPPQEVKEAIEEQVQNDLDDDQGILDIDYLEYNELEKDIEDYLDEDYDARDRLNYDALAGDFLPDLLDVVEELVRTTATLDDAQAGGDSSAGWVLKGGNFGLNKDSQYNIFEEDGNLILYRTVNGVINITIASGGNGFVNTSVEGYQGIITFGSGEGIEIFINQSN